RQLWSTRGYSRGLAQAALSRDGTRLLTSGPEKSAEIKLWDLAAYKLIKAFASDQGMAESLSLSTDNKLAIATFRESPTNPKLGPSRGATVGKVWELESGQVTRLLDSNHGWMCPSIFAPDGKMVLSRRWDGQDLTTGSMVLWNL